MEVDEHVNKRPISTFVHRVGAGAGRDVWVALVLVAIVLWLVAWLVAGRPAWLLHVYEVVVASVTLVMVFVLQHSNQRLEVATQLKLDELLRAAPQANDALVKVEAGADEDLVARTEQNLRYRDNSTLSQGADHGEDSNATADH